MISLTEHQDSGMYAKIILKSTLEDESFETTEVNKRYLLRQLERRCTKSWRYKKGKIEKRKDILLRHMFVLIRIF